MLNAFMYKDVDNNLLLSYFARSLSSRMLQKSTELKVMLARCRINGSRNHGLNI